MPCLQGPQKHAANQAKLQLPDDDMDPQECLDDEPSAHCSEPTSLAS